MFARCRWVAAKHLVQYHTQTVNIRKSRSLQTIKLFWRCIRNGTPLDCIANLAWFEMARDAKINQVGFFPRCNHDVCRFEVSEYDSWLAHMQVIKHISQFNAYSCHISNRKK